jgi:adenylate kinase
MANQTDQTNTNQTNQTQNEASQQAPAQSVGYALERKDGFVKFTLTIPSEEALRKISFEEVQTLQKQAAKAIKDIAKAVGLTLFVKGVPRD